ncbi:phosphonate C-P lyase system protein PhnG [Leptothoe sp. LEGE 181152]|uniref:Phosphonate C-P lyase system protein PhnG n=1 Tax=Adonisia turfae CCMR0081 TaxID=2292702 RepID=A0A6M0RIK8_9CYAN|nr:phosphonate C-P lyase system protein PhnG [Adonisia turfae]MDV3351163.1 phosphonate C-P lyase system protein PhnG [Leptothoe sp. LEGE 181152]NEZ56098.1 phosphonate C-P lyase system protein PhnG [Adonisia turfae CCMR0081]
MVKTALQPSRAVWMSVLAKAPLMLLEECVATLDDVPGYGFLRSPEVGLTMVRGRAEGTGQPFNLGEMTLTRCVVQLDELTGFGYVAGRSKRHAELAAVCDGLLQHPGWHDRVQAQVIIPLQAAAQEKREREAAEVESTRVNFFTMLRGES